MILSDPSLWRIVWKEYRAQRSFWLAVAGFGVGLMLLLVALLDAQGGQHLAPWLVAALLPAFYALGSAAILIASEREDGTVELLRMMSARPSRVFVGKLGYCVVSTLAIYALLLTSAAALAVALESYRNLSFGDGQVAQSGQWAVWLGLVLLPWGLFFSSVSRKVLTAACLAACAPFIAKIVMQTLFEPRSAEGTWWYLDLLLGFPLVAISYVAAARTLTGRTIEWKRPRMLWILPQSRGAGLKWLESTDESLPAWRRLFSRLLWIEIRQALTLGHALWIGGIYLALFAAWVPNQRTDANLFFLPLTMIPLFMGVWTFQAEGGQRVRYLAEQGISPAVVWLSKQIIWIFMTIATMSPFVLAVEIINRQRGNPDPDVWLYCTTAIALGYAAGQLTSMLIPRAVTAGFVGALLYALLAAWMVFMIVLQMPLAITVAPMIVVLLAATLGWSRNWLLERASWRSWLTLAAFLTLSCVAVWGGVGIYRLADVPSATAFYRPDWLAQIDSERREIDRPHSANEAETARMYQQAEWEFRDVHVSDSMNPVASAVAVEAPPPSDEVFQQVEQPLDEQLLGQMASGTPAAQVSPEVVPAKSAIDGWEHATLHERRMLDENRDVLELVLAATRRQDCAFVDLSQGAAELASVHDRRVSLANLILLSARELESQGRLDEALDRYVAVLRMARHIASRGRTVDWRTGSNLEELLAAWLSLWAAHPAQTVARLDRATPVLDAELSLFPALRHAILVDQFALSRSLRGDWSEAIAQSSERAPDDRWTRTLLLVFRRLCPWEASRSLAVADLITCSQLLCAEQLELGLRVPGRDLSMWKELLGAESLHSYVNLAVLNSINGIDVGARNMTHAEMWNSKNVKFFPLKLLATTYPLVVLAPHDNAVIWHVQMRRELSQRSLLLQLALIGWKFKHGEYPTQLEQLPQNRPDVMLDPYNGRPFEYRRDGFPNAVTFSNGITQPGVAVFWSGGSGNARVVPVKSSASAAVRFELTDAVGNAARPPGSVPEAYGFALP